MIYVHMTFWKQEKENKNLMSEKNAEPSHYQQWCKSQTEIVNWLKGTSAEKKHHNLQDSFVCQNKLPV